MIDLSNIQNWFCPAQLFEQGHLLKNRAVGISNGKVQAIVNFDEIPADAQTMLYEGILTPGFLDIQVNGGGGVLLNADPTPDSMQTIAAAHRKFGSTRIFPTVITDATDVLSRAVDAIIEVIGNDGIAGLHIEGPHISVDRRGTHKADFIRPFDETTFSLIRKLRSSGVPTIITVAPEVVSPEQIKAITKTGAIVSIGHSNATSRMTYDAFKAGARCATHLFNAMSPMTGREPGITGAVINSDAYVGIICDGIHVSDEMVSMAIRARAVKERMFLVSDAMPTVGGPLKFDLYGSTVHLKDNRLINAEGSLAGAHTTMLHSVQRLVNKIGLPIETALRMGISIPSHAIHLEQDKVLGQNLVDLICLDQEHNFAGDLATQIAKIV